MKKVSVIIPVYNTEKYLSECVDSVLNQTYQNFEIILVDDGSKDKSGEICDRYALSDGRVSVIHKENGGLSDARNRGLEAATGRYIYFLDSDDFIIPETLSELTDTIFSNGCDFVFFGADSFADNGDRVSQNYHRLNDYHFESGKSVFEKLQKNGEFHSAVQLMFFDKDFLINNSLFFEDGLLFEDMLFSFQAYVKASKVGFINKNYYKRRYRDGSIMTSSVSVKKFLSVCKIVKILPEFSKENRIENEDFAKRYIARNAFNALNIFSQLTRQEKEQSKNDLILLKELLKANSYFDDEALKARCHGKTAWLLCKVKEKVFG